MNFITHSECATALVAVGLTDASIIRALVAEVGLTREEAVMVTADARRSTPVHVVHAEAEERRRREIVGADRDAPERAEAWS